MPTVISEDEEEVSPPAAATISITIGGIIIVIGEVER
jgi:hypothetical protein